MFRTPARQSFGATMEKLMTTERRLSDKSKLVLTLIAEGRGYDHIVNTHAELSYFDIFRAAEEALWLSEPGPHVAADDGAPSRTTLGDMIAEARRQHPQAYAPWTRRDEAELTAMHMAVARIEEMAERFQRAPSAIRRRLRRLGFEVGREL